MRGLTKGFGSQKPFEINELQEKSHFSPPEQSEELSHQNAALQKSIKPEDIDQAETIVEKEQEQKQSHSFVLQQKKINKRMKTSQFPNNQSQVSSKQTQKINSETTWYTFFMYLGIFVYLCDFFMLITPGLKEVERIGRVTQIVLEFMFVILVVVLALSYEKARRTSPGYPASLSQTYKVSKVQQALALPQISQLKIHTTSLLIQKAQLKQILEKNPTPESQQLYSSFQYKFFVEQTKWCDKCVNIKLPRVRHCSECNQCIQRMDHHCVWLNNCVGKRNHKFFMLFLFMLIFILTFFVLVGIIELIDGNQSVGKYLENRYGAFWKVAYIIGEVMATGLWLYYVFVFCEQLYLILNNLTFVESLSEVLLDKRTQDKCSAGDAFGRAIPVGIYILNIQLVQQVQGNPMMNFQSEQHFKHERNQI